MYRLHPLRTALAAALLLAGTTSVAAAQQPDAAGWLAECREAGGWGRNQPRACELRELTLPADGRGITVDGRANGSVSVQGWDRNEIRVQALVSGHGRSADDAQSIADAIRVVTDDRTVRAEGPRVRDGDGWSVSYRVYVPRRTDMELRATNGALRVSNVAGQIVLNTSNGAIALEGVSGDVRGRTANGSVSVRLEGRRWDGSGLDLTTSNGSVSLHIPDGYSAQLETGTVNGRIDTDFPITVQGRVGRDLTTRLGEGGAPLRVRTTNGAVRIRRT